MAYLSGRDKCDTCGAEEDVFWYCDDCEEVLCHKCKPIHYKDKRTINHRIISILAERKRRVQNSPVILCKKHTTKELNQYCENCDTLACMMCIHKIHKQHNWIPLEEFKDAKERELNDVVEKLYNKLTVFQNAISNEDKLYKQRITCIEQIEHDVKDQKSKIFKEVTLLCDKQLAQLSSLKHKANKFYMEACAKLKLDCTQVRSVIQTVHSGMDSGDPNTMIHVSKAAKRAAAKSENVAPKEMNIPQFQRGDVTPSLVVQAQGKVCVTAEAKITPGPNKTTPVVSKSCQTQKYENSGAKVKSKYSLKGEKNSITIIVPVKQYRTWVATFGMKRLTLLDREGEFIQNSDEFDKKLEDGKKFNTELLISSDKSVLRLSANGRILSTFADLAPYFARGLCITGDHDVLVCLVSKPIITGGKDVKDTKVVRLDKEGSVVQTIQYDPEGRLLFAVPMSITSLPSGEVIVVDTGKKERVVCLDKNGKRLWIWNGDIEGQKVPDFSPLRIAHGKDCKLYITDFYDRVFRVLRDGSNAMCHVNKSLDIAEPTAIAVDKKGQLLIGADGGHVYVI